MKIKYIHRTIRSIVILSACFITGIFTSNAQSGIQEIYPQIERDATLNKMQAATNFGINEELISMAWTCGAGDDTCILRSIFDFDMDMVPEGAAIISAKLSLFANPDPLNPSHFGFNEAYIQRVKTDWDETLVNWSNQPEVSDNFTVDLAMSESSSQDYIDIDVTDLVEDMIRNSASSYGFMLQLKTENIFRSLNFASSNYPDDNYHPRLSISYEVATAVDNPLDIDTYLEVFPNPFTELVYVNYELDQKKTLQMDLFDANGRSIATIFSGEQTAGSHSQAIHASDYNLLPGIYILSILSEDGIRTFRKIVYSGI